MDKITEKCWKIQTQIPRKMWKTPHFYDSNALRIRRSHDIITTGKMWSHFVEFHFYLYLNSDNVTQSFLVYQNKFLSKCIIFRKKNYKNTLKNWNRRWKIIVKNMSYHCKSSAIISRFMQMIWRHYLWSARKWKKTDCLHSKALFTPCTEHWILFKIRGKVLCFYGSLPLTLKVKWFLLLFREKKVQVVFFLFVCFSLSQIYKELYYTIDNIDYEKDLEWWSKNYGATMAFNVPQFVVCLFIYS